MRTASDRHITWCSLDTYGWEGYLVRLRDRSTKRYIPARFPIKLYANKRAAKKAAKLWRDEKMVELGYPKSGTLLGKGTSHLKGKPRKVSGAKIKANGLPVGVSWYRKKLASGEYRERFVACISDLNSKQLRMEFIYDYKISGAKASAEKKARSQRKKWEREFYKN